MDIEAVTNQLSQLVESAGNEVQAKVTAGDMNDPAQMLKAQFAIQQYSVFVSYESAIMRAVKDMLSGIIQKI
ncbi:type III secretion system needle filament subunit SctF [Rouxiella badensis]|jgi:type III secretion protein F|uniref:EscF/YscF/HrpA family type III secretion system needle major subunit n=1 Tax=Rouxiella badensis TaxID=1646377 RepID=A0A1X0WI52_9GAMM|nr:type III secretion system needle filament subunit SctF [Rouxiella badensis]MCC3703336.1 type III secretion system needle protein SsaG [Rouxiella badensis]MCC3718275.1 type III secretion system needle protein SsaG [Rouxiella badensis]MCC3726957.1 type III secretion system needle protein SsaG [Rouxiella badensis]MCC3731759.1 type III secretion system needle protein SsaG [Rouxiella badensis]MCC3738694.1 type III secretion system needle protein SsaG [Rouxiella badensis]